MQNLDNLRHSCAHLLSAAVMEIWPDAKRTIGPPIENGFYYDFDFKNPISENDLAKKKYPKKKQESITKTTLTSLS
jgi:threonyl-tRNA synthetase